MLKQLPELLLPWYEREKRVLPWRADREPYHVWVSEIMLQQTRVEAVRGYYARFLQALPTLEALAACEDDRLYKLWEGLGYYSRARNLKRAANVLLQEHGGRFPADYAALQTLPGIGAYTAGAICSICFEQPTPAVDGNVLRVWARLTGSEQDVTQARTKRAVFDALAAVYPPGRCGDFTQALMELGATVCVPNRTPQCARCPVRTVCSAYESGRWRVLPVRAEKKPRRHEARTVLILTAGDALAVCRRPKNGLLAGLWELPNVSGTLTAQQALELAEQWGCRPLELTKSSRKQHIFTHIQWDMTGYSIRCGAAAPRLEWADAARMAREISLPTAFRQFLPDSA